MQKHNKVPKSKLDFMKNKIDDIVPIVDPIFTSALNAVAL